MQLKYKDCMDANWTCFDGNLGDLSLFSQTKVADYRKNRQLNRQFGLNRVLWEKTMRCLRLFAH
jgi:hypothetical protein